MLPNARTLLHPHLAIGDRRKLGRPSGYGPTAVIGWTEIPQRSEHGALEQLSRVSHAKTDVETIFQNTAAHRIWLGVFPENTRARRAYEAVGFQAEGIARGSAFFGGRHRDEVVMSLLRPDWAAGRQLSASETT